MSRTIIIAVLVALLLAGTACWSALVAYWGPKRWRKMTFTGVFVVSLVIIVGCNYFSNAQTHLYHTFWYGMWRQWTTVGNGYAVGMILACCILGPLTAIYIYWNRKVTDPKVLRSRRRFFKAAAVAVPTVTVGGAVVEAYVGAKELDVTKVNLTFPALPAYLKNYKIVQLSDVHLGAHIDLDDFNHIMDLAAKQGADRLVITGDLIDQVEWIHEVAERLRRDFSKYPDGIDYILGNHEYYRNLPLVLECLSKVVRVYRNSSLQLSEGAWPVYLAGVEYPFTESKSQRKAYLDQALTGVPSEAFTILLAHHPDFIGDAFERSIPVTLSGHTHGGQINVMGHSLIPVAKPYWKGLYQKNQMYGYVSRGTGHWWPMRYHCPREMTVFTFVEKG